MRVVRVALALSTVLGCARVAGAQAPIPLARFVSDLVASAARIDATAATELGDFAVASQLAGLPSAVNQSLGLQLATTPFDMGLDTSRPGFDAVPSHYGFGPSFAVHAGAVGRGKLSVSFNYQNVSFGGLDGLGLDSSQLGFVLRAPAPMQALYGRDILHESLALRIQQDVATLGIVYGATDRLDVGVGIPVVHLEMEGQVQSRVFGSVYTLTPRGPDVPPDAHFFDVYPATPAPAPGCRTSSVDITGVDRAPSNIALFNMVELAERTVTRRCDASGLGDVVAHGRYRLNRSDASALAVTLDARLPTGDADQLLGSGGTRATAALVWSGRAGRFMPHATAGYTWGLGHASSLFNTVTACTPTTPAPPATRSSTCATAPSPTPLDLKLPDEIAVAAGADVVFFRRLTVAGNAFVRRVQNLTTFSVTTPSLSPGDPTITDPVVVAKGTGATLSFGVAAAQVALTNRTVLKANVLFPLFGDGLTPRVGFGAGLGVRY